MFDLISQSMLFLLESLKNLVGDYGWAIIALTVLVRVVLWPVSQSQMRSMKMMQELQPKLKTIQERYKTDPQRLQTEMFKLYKDHKFNPLGGCLPMLVQLPIFIGLYWAISNPQFLAAGDPVFLNAIHLKHTGILSHAGTSNDGRMTLSAEGGGGLFGMGKDHIIAGERLTLVLKNGTRLEQKVNNPNDALTILPKELRPGIPVQIRTSFEKLKLEGYEDQVQSIELPIVNSATKESEQVVLTPQGNNAALRTQVETVPGKTSLNVDVLILVAIFAATMLISQRMMTKQTAQPANDQQQQMMKLMPIMFSVMLFIFPIPAGVLLYMDTNSLFQIFQTWIFQRQSGTSSSTPPSQSVLDVKPGAPKA